MLRRFTTGCLLIAILLQGLVVNSEVFAFEHGNFKNPAQIEIQAKNKSTLQMKACKLVVENSLNEYQEYLDSLKKVVIHNDTNLRRGLANANYLYIRCLPDLEEFLNVLVHELGHIIDLGYFKGKNGTKTKFLDFGDAVLSDDRSYEFYSISWSDDNQLSHRATSDDFVSGYAMTNSFEDFAESFLLYFKYREYFKQIATENPILNKKFNFFEQYFATDFEVYEVSLESQQLYFKLGQIKLFDATQLHKELEFSL